MEESIEWSARIDQALEEYPEVQEYLDAIRGNIEALSAAINVGELAEHIGAEHAHIVHTHLLGSEAP